MHVSPEFISLFLLRKLDSFFSVKYNPERDEDLLDKTVSIDNAHCWHE